MIYPVAEEHVDQSWPLVLPFIELCIERGVVPVEPEELRQVLKSGEYKLFLLTEDKKCKGICILNIRHEFSTKYLNVYMMSYTPDYTGQDDDHESLVEFARKLGVKQITYFGRPGFQKLHKQHGWKVAQVLMVKEV